MFSAAIKQPFGTNNTGFGGGFNTTTASPFGQTQMFGSTTSNAFGAPQPTPAFGQTTTPMFGQPQQQSTPMFGSTAAPAFGSQIPTSNFGTSLFGQTSQPQQSTSLFGASTSNTAFGQPPKTTGFTFPSTGLFGQTAAPQQSTLFQPSTSTNIFNTSGFGQQPAQTGTVIKFIPVTGTDSMQKSGSSTMINTKHHSITCMKEYEGKSFEELRYEDYLANRKGPTNTGFGAQPPFGAVVSSAPPMFGQPDNKLTFGSSGFGQNTFGMANQSTANQNVFGKVNTGFGATATNTFGTFTNPAPTSNIFGTQPSKQPFGTQPAPMFGTVQPQQQAGFGTTSLFGQTATQPTNTGFFTKQQTTFPSTQQNPFTFGQTTATTQPAPLFQPPKTTGTGFGIFGQSTTAPTFGQAPSTGFGSFGTFNANKTATPAFGQTQTQAPAFGGLGLQSGNTLFGNNQQKAPLFGGPTANTSLFGGGITSQPTNTFSLSTQQPAIPTTTTASAAPALSELPPTDNPAGMYGYSPFLDGMGRPVTAVKEHKKPVYATNPKEIDSVLDKCAGFPKKEGEKNTSKPPVVVQRKYKTEAEYKWTLFNVPSRPETEFVKLNLGIRYNPKRLNLNGNGNGKNGNGNGKGGKNNENGKNGRNGNNGDKKGKDKKTNDKSTNVSNEDVKTKTGNNNNSAKETLATANMHINSPSASLTIHPPNDAVARLLSNLPHFAANTDAIKVKYLGSPRKILNVKDGSEQHTNDSESGLNSPETPGQSVIGAVSETDAGSVVSSNSDTINAKSDPLKKPDVGGLTPITVAMEKHNQMVESSPVSSKVQANNTLPKKLDAILSKPANSSINTSHSENTTEAVNKPEEVDYDTCGIICTRPEYYTIPHLKEIQQYKNDDGTCMIQGFTIGRVGFGNVFFPDLIDVTDLNIDELVHFRYRELTIYNDDHKKPPVGEGLNRSAQVTLDAVYPKVARNGVDITIEDPNEIIAMNFCDTLKDVCGRNNMSFVDYRPETGSWVFNVHHFSKYGLTDSDEEESRKRVQLEMKQKLELEKQDALRLEKEQAQARLGAAKISTNAEKHKTTTEKVILRESLEDTEDSGDLPYVDAVDSLTNLDTVQQIHQIPEQSIKPFLKLPDHRGLTTHERNVMSMKEMFYQDEKEVDNRYDDDDLMEADIDYMPSNIARPELPKLKPITMRPKIYKVHRTYNSLEKSLIPLKGFMDAAMFKGRSFKVGWTSGLTLVTLLSRHQNSDRNTVNAVDPTYYSPRTLAVMEVVKHMENVTVPDPFITNYGEYMKIILKHSEIQMQDDIYEPKKIPYLTIKPSNKLLTDIALAVITQCRFHDSDKKMRYYGDIWALCVALWGDPEDEDYDEEELYLYRREVFDKWLEDVTYDFMITDFTENRAIDPFEKIFILLSGHKIDEASHLAMKKQMPQIAMIIGQLNSSIISKYHIEYQIAVWDYSTAVHFMKDAILKIYLLGSGYPYLRGINVCENLDWKRCLALHYWYLSPSSEPLTYAIRLYENAFSKDYYAAPPRPVYEGATENTWDIMYYIMLLYTNHQTDMDLLLSPASHTNETCDYTLSWLLEKVFLSLQIGLISDETKYHIATSLSAQLEQLGLFKFAIFVLLYLPDARLKKILIQRILDRNLTDEDEPTAAEILLLNDLKVPKDWLYIVKANKCQQLYKYWQAYQHLAHGQLWQEATDLAFARIVPDLVANHHFRTLEKVLNTVAIGRTDVFRWKNQAGIVTEFLRLYKILHKNIDNLPSAELSTAYSDLLVLIRHLRSFPQKTANQVMIISEISKRCSIYVRMIYKAVGPEHNRQYFTTMLGLLNQLVMPPDYKYEEVMSAFKAYHIIR